MMCCKLSWCRTVCRILRYCTITFDDCSACRHSVILPSSQCVVRFAISTTKQRLSYIGEFLSTVDFACSFLRMSFCIILLVELVMMLILCTGSIHSIDVEATPLEIACSYGCLSVCCMNGKL